MMPKSPDLTGPKQAETKFRKGQSGNPAGRPKGARSRLCEDFLKALHEDFQKHGVKAIESVRLEKPEVYFNGVVKLLPQQFGLDDETKGGVTVIINKDC
ncbi:DUF5681 domain-containing protein [Acetobacter cerevisiae]|uniref:DUF5681 domain-containing protein n=1 Tax=Acetobacter cerevisiae TaxID=178900 RepID=UPI00209D4C2E|nr:DUF5681 domain-containing protein [Acetobacter cerevisiae]MCP1270552.1 DUF5681 domain-containing protein [Acetobacter cerevisiae]MCP1278506.1 DUF5681 domain-containing protein [Acetobacter cerevisiae]